MLKHASPLRSSSRLGRTSVSSRSSLAYEDSFQVPPPPSTESQDYSSDLLLSSSLLPSTLRPSSRITSHAHITKPKPISPTVMSPLTLSVASTSEKFNERGVDCEGLVPSPVPRRAALGGGVDSVPVLGWGIGPVITQGKAIVRRGLSFTLRREPDVTSIRSVKSEGQVPSTAAAIKHTTLNNSEVTPTAETKNFHQTSKMSNTQKLSSSTFASLFKTDNQVAPVAEPKTIAFGKQQPSPQQHTPPPSCLPIDLHRTLDPSDPLRSLLAMPGIHAEVRLPDTAVTSSPTMLNPDTMSLTSADSLATSSSGRTSSRSWGSSAAASTSSQSSSVSSSSSTENTSTTIRVFAKCLRSDIEYKTVSVGARTTCGELVATLLSKYRMRHRDPNLFYLTMEVTVKRWPGPPCRSLLVLEESARPAQLALCRPLGDARFALQMRKGGVIRVHDTVLMPGSQYKSLLVSYRTTAEEVVQLMLHCYGQNDCRSFYSLHQVCRTPTYTDVPLPPDARPLELKSSWPPDRRDDLVFVLRRNMSTALSLRKLSQQSGQDGRVSPRSSSVTPRSKSLEAPRPRCHSVPTPPPRSRKNIHSIQQHLLNTSLCHQPPSPTQHQLLKTPAQDRQFQANHFPSAVTNHVNVNNKYHSRDSGGRNPGVMGSSTTTTTRYHQQLVTHNTVNYNVHFNRPPELTEEETSTMIDCTLATPVMTRIGAGEMRPRRSLSASRMPIDRTLSLAPDTVDGGVTHDQPQIKGCCTESSSSNQTEEYNKPCSTQVLPPPIPPSPHSSTPSPTLPPTIPPPPASFTPPVSRTQKKVAINEEISTEPPPLPSTSPPPVTPEPSIRIIKPCIKYPKVSTGSHSAPVSPALTSRHNYKLVAQTPPVPPLPSEDCLNRCVGSDRARELGHSDENSDSANIRTPQSITDDLKLKQIHDNSSCSRNCQNCFYI